HRAKALRPLPQPDCFGVGHVTGEQAPRYLASRVEDEWVRGVPEEALVLVGRRRAISLEQGPIHCVQDFVKQDLERGGPLIVGVETRDRDMAGALWWIIGRPSCARGG